MGSSATYKDFFFPGGPRWTQNQNDDIFRVLFPKPMADFSPNRWFSQCVFQESGQELVNGLKACLEGQCLHQGWSLWLDTCRCPPRDLWQWLKTLLAVTVGIVEVLRASGWRLEPSMLQKTATPLPPPPQTIIWLKISVVGLVRNTGLAWRLKKCDSVLEATGLEKWP